MNQIILDGLYLWEEDYIFENDSLTRFLDEEMEIREILIDEIEI